MCLAMLAGFVDAVGFLELRGLFVSFMSGNTTRLAVAAADGSHLAPQAALLICAFVLGVILGSILSTKAPAHRKSAVLALVSSILFAAAIASLFNGPAVLLMAVAMGCSNTVFQRDGEVSIGVTYMTGTLVKLGQRIAGASLGGDRTAWIPYLLLWLSLVAGAFAGALGYAQIGLQCLWIAGTAAAALSLVARKMTQQTNGATVSPG